MSYRDRASFGKRQEFAVIAELLRRGLDVYVTLVDDRQIDCIIRFDDELSPRYLDVQVKARSKMCAVRNAATFSGMGIRSRPNLFFVFYSEHAGCHWVIPSTDLVRLASRNKSGKHKGKYNITLTSCRKGQVCSLPRFQAYVNAFVRLEEATSDSVTKPP